MDNQPSTNRVLVDEGKVAGGDAGFARQRVDAQIRDRRVKVLARGGRVGLQRSLDGSPERLSVADAKLDE
jgi:hypothetical protein